MIAASPTVEKKSRKSDLAVKLEALRRDAAAATAQSFEQLLDIVQAQFGLTRTERKKLHDRLWAFSFTLRQPDATNLSCNSTPFFLRWIDDETSWLISDSPRFALPEHCELVYRTLLVSLLQAQEIGTLLPMATRLGKEVLGDDFQPNSLTCIYTRQPITSSDIKRALGYSTSSVGAFEIPCGYIRELDQGGYHRPENVGWMKPLHVVYQLRGVLRGNLAGSGVPDKAIRAVLEKIGVKSYSTDKQTMPPYYSNRDIRWATWVSETEAREAVAKKKGMAALTTPAPTSQEVSEEALSEDELADDEYVADVEEEAATEVKGIQYSSHFNCAMVELELIAQLYEFSEAPELEPEVAALVATYRGHPLAGGGRPCLITGQTLRFTEFAENARNQRGGKSAFHVGHMVPLTKGGKHERANIAWLSDVGNRIQGNDNLEEIEATLLQAIAYHVRRDISLNKPADVLRARLETLQSLTGELEAHLRRATQ